MNNIVIRHYLVLIILFLTSLNVQAQHKTQVVLRDFSDQLLKETMQNNINSVLAVVNDAYDNGISTIAFPEGSLTEDARTTLVSIWGNSHFYCTKAGILALRVLNRYNGYQVRDIPVCFVRADNEKSKYQQLFINFDRNGIITEVNIAPEMHQYVNIMNKVDANDVTEITQREIIEDVIAKFRTAYNTKDIDYLEAIYSDDALIITGNVFKRRTADGITVQESKYTVKTKQEYINSLKNVFQKNAWINIKLTTREIVQHVDYPYLYGVSLFQDWNASGGYHDSGYLFLLFDFRDLEQPTIWVRTWQAAEDNEGTPVKYKAGELYSLDNIDWAGCVGSQQ